MPEQQSWLQPQASAAVNYETGVIGGKAMEDWRLDLIRSSSIGLPDGGDTHVDAWENGRGFTVTTRLPGDVEFHENFRFHELFGQRTPAAPEVLSKLPW